MQTENAECSPSKLMFCITAEPTISKGPHFTLKLNGRHFRFAFHVWKFSLLGQWLASVCRKISNFHANYGWTRQSATGQRSHSFSVWHDIPLCDQRHLAIANWLWHTHFSIVTDGYRCVTRHALGRHERGFSIWFQSTFSKQKTANFSVATGGCQLVSWPV